MLCKLKRSTPLHRFAALLLAGIGAEIALIVSVIDLLGTLPAARGFGPVQMLGVLFGGGIFIIGMAIYHHSNPIKIPVLSAAALHRFIPLSALILLAAFLRFLNLGGDSLWVDELASWLRTTHPTVRDALWEGHIDSMWPAYHIPLFFTSRVLGDSEFALRFPSVLFGVMHIPLIYQIGRRLYSHREGLIAALLMAVLLNPIAYSQEARSYSMLIFFTLLSTYLWIDWQQTLHRTGKVPPAALLRYFVAAMMLPYLQWFGLLLIAVHGMVGFALALRHRRGVLPLMLTYFGLAVVVLPLMTTLFGTVEIDNEWIPRTKGVFAAFTQFIAWAFNESTAWAYGVMIIGIGSLASRWLPKQDVPTEPRHTFFHPTWVLVIWLLVPLSALYLFSIVVKPAWIPRYLMVSLPAVYLLLARAFTGLPISLKLRRVLPTAFAAASLIYVFGFYSYYTTPQKAQFREVVSYMLNRDAQYPQSLIITHTGGPPEYMSYYFQRAGSDRQPTFDGSSRQAIKAVETAASSRQVRYIWYITAHYRPQAALIDYLDASFRQVESAEFWHATVRLYEVESLQPDTQ